MEDWLPLCRTILIPKDVDTRNKAKYRPIGCLFVKYRPIACLFVKYRPIACLNITYKLHTGMLYTFVEDHCSSNNIITTEQAGGKKGSWGCVDQLLTNKMILEEVVKHRPNIFTMWFDYKKTFDMIPHKWLLEAMKLAKVPEKLISAVNCMLSKWSTLSVKKKSVESD